GVDQLAVDWMLGHKINPVTEAYFKNDPQTLKAKYIDAYENLTLEKVIIKDATTKQYDDLLEKLKNKEDDYDRLEKRMELVENFLADKGVRKELDKR
ncbi:MAG: hypothetical protein GYA36_21305, partial [Veillonellaceae bacterium]|nr:hypothetical protein [Veillonellaceae bacterium]